jgi:hypothetical protein
LYRRLQNLHLAGTPFAIASLLCGHPHLRPDDERVLRVRAAFGGWNVFVVDDLRVGNLDATCRAVAPLHVEPALFRCRPVNNRSAKRAGCAGDGHGHQPEKQCNQAEAVPKSHAAFDAKTLPGAA